MKNILIYALFLFVSINCYAQKNIAIKFIFEEDDSVVNASNPKCKFIMGKDTINIAIENGMLLMPMNLFNQKGIVIINVNGNQLDFVNVPIGWDGQNLQWIVGVDHKPFNKERFWNTKDWKKKKLMYYLDYGNGKVMIDYKPKKKPKSYKS